VTERRPPDDPADEPDEDENPEFDRFEELTKKLLNVDPDALPAEETTGADGDKPVDE
jgi:hypothetical protein